MLPMSEICLAFKSSCRLTAECFDEEMFEIYRALLVTAPPTQDDVVVITSVVDGRHMRSSLHYEGRAVDVRFLGDRPGGLGTRGSDGWTIASQQRELAREWALALRQALGPDYDVVVEGDHIHIEYDPR